jgi:dienelactone hydrolase
MSFGSNYPGQNYPGGPQQPGSFGPSSPSPFAARPTDLYGAPEPPRSSGSGCLWALAAVVGIGGLGLILCCGGFVWFVTNTPEPTAAAKQPWNVAAIPAPAFPDRGPPQNLGPDSGNINLYTIRLGPTGGYYQPPGHGGTMYLYLPPGQHPVGSLPCVLITGAGTTLLHGYEFGGGPEESGDSPEFLPYAQAGMAVLAYELDGQINDFDKSDADGYLAFKAACAGLVNARNAFEYVLARVPEVNPRQIYAAGHSSAGTAALLFAEHEPRLAGCVAYAPCSDVQKRIGRDAPGFVLRLEAMDMPGLVDFIVQSSPRTHESRLNCPLFLFHAEGDENVPVSESKNFAARLQGPGRDVTLKTVPGGDHHESMLQDGIPAGIEWIKTRAARK